MHPLTSRTMAILARERLFARQLILDRTTVTLALPLDVEPFPAGLVVDLVRRAELPLVFGPVGAVAGLVLVRLAALGLFVAVLVFVHFERGGGGDGARVAGLGCGEKRGGCCGEEKGLGEAREGGGGGT